MQLWLVTLGVDEVDRGAAASALRAAGGRVAGCALPTDPPLAALNAALDDAAGRRLVLRGSVPDVSRVLRRMMRRDELTSTETAVLPLAPVPFLNRFGVSADLAAAARIAASGPVRTVGVLKDDSGNLIIDHAVVRPWVGERLWVRAYVDDEPLCDGEISGLRIERGAGTRPDGSDALRATVIGRRWRRPRTGRGLTLASDEAAISSDGAERDQPRRKRIWWDEPEQWRLATA